MLLLRLTKLTRRCEKLRYCEKCRVKIRSNNEFCSLCQSKTILLDEDVESSFPKIKTQHKNKFVYKLLGVISAFIILITVIVNFIFKTAGFWSIYVIAGIGTIWIIAVTPIIKKKNVLKALYFGTLVAILMAILWDVGTGLKYWSFNFVIPLVITFATISTFILTKAIHLSSEEYSVYLCCLGILNLLLVFSYMFFTTIKLTTIICFGVNLLILIVAMIIDGKQIIYDVRKRIHI